MTINYKQVFAIKKQCENKIKQVCPKINNKSGIYFMIREENGFKYAYIGQAINLLERLASHINPSSFTQHIDLSLKKHGLWNENNPTGWRIYFLNFSENELNDKEQYYIKKYANAGYQMRNSTSGSQGEGKESILDKPTKGYLQGLHNGYEKARKKVAHWFDLHLTYNKKKNTVNAQKALEKFEKFLKGEETNE